MANFDQPLAFFSLLLFISILILLIIGKLTTTKFVAASLPVLILFIYFSVGYRITEMSLASGTIKLASDQAQKYAAQIREVRNRVNEEQGSIAAASMNISKTDALVSELSRKNASAEIKLATISSELVKSDSLLSNLQKQSEYETTVSAAQSDDRHAFEKLKGLASDPTSPFQTLATSAWKTIRTQANMISSMRTTYTVNWPASFDPKKINFDALSQMFFQTDLNPGVPDFELRSALLDYIVSRQDFSQDAKLKFLLDVMRTTGSIKIFANAALDFNQTANIKSNDLTSISSYEDWWRSHSHEQ